MLGISVYLSQYDPDYVQKSAQMGAKYVFTSLQLPEEDDEQVAATIQKLLAQCNQLGLILVPDISPETFNKLSLPAGDYATLREFKIQALRLDYGFDDFDLIKNLQQDFLVFLNASVINDFYLEKAEQNGIDFNQLRLTYNFYPEEETGMDWGRFKQRNFLLKSRGLVTQAFIPGDKKKRFPLYAGLPSVERHRGMNPYVAAVELIHEAQVDDIFVGDLAISEKYLAWIKDYQEQKIMHLPCHMRENYTSLADQEIMIRADQPEKLIRLLLPRTPEVEIDHPLKRIPGAIVMQNKLAKRYSGEVYLIKKELPFDSRSNVIGYVDPEFLPLLEQIDENTRIVFC